MNIPIIRDEHEWVVVEEKSVFHHRLVSVAEEEAEEEEAEEEEAEEFNTKTWFQVSF